jgi:hypothetical protein
LCNIHLVQKLAIVHGPRVKAIMSGEHMSRTEVAARSMALVMKLGSGVVEGVRRH